MPLKKANLSKKTVTHHEASKVGKLQRQTSCKVVHETLNFYEVKPYRAPENKFNKSLKLSSSSHDEVSPAAAASSCLSSFLCCGRQVEP